VDLHDTSSKRIPQAGEAIETAPQRPTQRGPQEIWDVTCSKCQKEPLLRYELLHAVPILGCEDIATTMLCAAMAGLWGLIIQLVAVVLRIYYISPPRKEFLAFIDRVA
jgi:hypothetical protein